MTKEQAVQKLLIWASKQVGYREGANNYNQYAPKWSTAGGWNVQNQPWCDVFVDVGFIECFGLENAARMTYQPVGGFSAGCAVSASYYRQNGAYFASPEPGDQIFFYVSGGINHTGIVTRVSGGSVVTIEGNSSDMVNERVYAVGASNIAGYGRPDWSVVADVDTTDSTPDTTPVEQEVVEDLGTVDLEVPVLRAGMGGAVVAAAQGALEYVGCNVGIWGVDGDFGPDTRQAVYNFQKRHGLNDDGIIGEETWRTLLK